MKKCFGLLVVLLLLAACATPPYLYYGNTSHSYYRAVKKQDAKSVANYKASLEQVFDVSTRLGRPVPPGLYCDYALLLVAENNTTEAKRYLELEKTTWQESGTLVDFLMQRYGLGN
ncbi:MAG: DUF4810 domain-containing protein [Candidatus Cloacimonetes bacterium HGW-Cloacimonetes-3]|jgi:hypothetical protein|nr:MAG: DUF4810 domain-containing protein [Candidatus Cloacimonetes bacterium HGW-Cloacimonetes-3]